MIIRPSSLSRQGAPSLRKQRQCALMVANIQLTARRAVALNGRRPWHRTLATEVDTRANDAAFMQTLREDAGLTPATEQSANPKDVSPKPLAQPGRRRVNEPKKDSIVDAYLTFKHMRKSGNPPKHCEVKLNMAQNALLVAMARK